MPDIGSYSTPDIPHYDDALEEDYEYEHFIDQYRLAIVQHVASLGHQQLADDIDTLDDQDIDTLAADHNWRPEDAGDYLIQHNTTGGKA